MASESLPPLRSSNDETLSEPLLPNMPSGKSVKRKGTIKLSKRLRHCRSAPELDESNPHIDVNEKLVLPVVKDHDTKRLILIGAAAFVVYSCLGVACFYAMGSNLQGKSTNLIVDALYFCVVTMTTVGYGDLVPKGVPERLLTCVYVFLGFGLVGLLLGSAADFLVERQEIMLKSALSEIDKESDFSEFNESGHETKVRLKVAIAGTIFSVLFVIGIVVMIEVEGLGFVEAFYLVCVTVTTLGYGDFSFQTMGGRAFAVVWILVSTVNVAQLFLYIAELYTERRRQSVLKFVLSRKTTASDLEAADMDNDGVVSASEFVIYKLKEMGKIEEEDIVEILKEFDSLDADDSGTLSPFDLKLAQTTEL
ncbi:hypothetical protein GOP47_0001169 [Adiantum capillus-veneris]|uniref:Uncharacterized protein n=1 Tax=Adiantum capillus-veneris TaxID=13818 RepID=A0A9D4ZTS3_ADICA|nr:hypothetical protein GOP47_0001169 [Adiantum capillus-veneris]